jgi:hypothetical protein
LQYHCEVERVRLKFADRTNIRPVAYLAIRQRPRYSLGGSLDACA